MQATVWLGMVCENIFLNVTRQNPKDPKRMLVILVEETVEDTASDVNLKLIHQKSECASHQKPWHHYDDVTWTFLWF